MVEVQTQVRVASGVEAIVVKAADRVEPLDSECNIRYHNLRSILSLFFCRKFLLTL